MPRIGIRLSTIRFAAILIGCIGILVLLISSWIATRQSQALTLALTRSEAEHYCKELLISVAKHHNLDPAKFRLVFDHSTRYPNTNSYRGWDFYYISPEDPDNVYHMYWMQEDGGIDWNSMSRECFLKRYAHKQRKPVEN